MTGMEGLSDRVLGQPLSDARIQLDDTELVPAQVFVGMKEGWLLLSAVTTALICASMR